MVYKIERLTDQVSILGEAPFWDEEKQVLYFVDIYGKYLQKYDPATNVFTKVEIEDLVHAVIPVKGKPDEFFIPLNEELQVINWDGQSAEYSVVKSLWKFDDKLKGKSIFNDAKCDQTGRLWIGTLDSRIVGLPAPKVDQWEGFFISYQKGKVVTHATNIGISNGIAFDDVLKKLYFVDTASGIIDQFDFEEGSGTLANRETVFTFDKHKLSGYPDGLTIDADGNLWVAAVTAGKILKIDPRKPETLLDTIVLPAIQPTSVTFGGPQLDELYVTTARFPVEGVTPEPPVNGSLYKITNLGVKGLPSNKFVY
ncbi:regucalcin-like [Cylas formicarius]|uniref:regucalcin-like n=1 Tax=Cylas formicarius TaxID=197179 RepID=UPI00295865E2|nr:regucalcin-like [Cylas formicarius]